MGITPAYAGKTSCLFTVNLNGGDHPRVCGKDSHKIFVYAVHLGITPAYAGKTDRR